MIKNCRPRPSPLRGQDLICLLHPKRNHVGRMALGCRNNPVPRLGKKWDGEDLNRHKTQKNQPGSNFGNSNLRTSCLRASSLRTG